MTKGMDQQKKAVDSGYWTLFRYNPDLVKEGKNPLQLDSKAPSIPLADYIYNETRFKALKEMAPERAEKFLALSQAELERRYRMYEHMTKLDYSTMKK
jgi:pyruvate-ferredoxin/flavodoxin oxidoreductase